VEIRIEKLVYGGAGMARTANGIIFVDKVLPGEVVDVEIVDRKKDYAVARLLGILEPAPARREPRCPNFDTVGCCGWDHIGYSDQLAIKDAIVRESLKRQGGIEWVEPIRVVSGPEREYRLRATFRVLRTPAGARLGFVREGTNDIVAIERCAALMPELNQFVADAGHALGERDAEGIETIRAVVSPDTGQLGATIHRGRERIRWTDREPRTRVGGIEYRLRADSFFQPNRYLLGEIMRTVTDGAGSGSPVLDLFAGSGFFSLPLARAGAQVTAVDRKSVANAVWNVRHNKIGGIRTVKSSAWAFVLKSSLRPEIVILDPPRTGASRNVVGRVAQAHPRRIVYVSCNPTTFAPEARVLVDNGFRMTSLTFVDQFPGTPHIETVAVFETPK
jgi:23S rRNA (uracil1939-C5)-methyltransferase